MNDIESKINVIGERMMNDPHWASFADIEYSPERGIMPRCLYYEKSSESQNGIIIVGLNPGRARQAEMDHFIEDRSYQSAVRCWSKNLYGFKKFFKPLRDLVHASGITGPILWTELIHCQSSPQIRMPSIQTIRYSVNTYLKDEVALMPDAPIIAVGGKVFEPLSYLFFNRKIIGVPHPSGASPISHKAYRKDGSISQEIIGIVRNELLDGRNNAVQVVYENNAFIRQA